ncbi:SDR family NAD(P)-dependent oxidoreductase [Bordetella flabilis]|uniref:3-hydroxyacyl-CoA dehydrogenase n=1 Tax=Bordetella flabilis TaxID=463014 RepID=A0A193GA12_9BORD|nr:SDR family NAD(P)-dependent oxidoreductase [Bordetella flabilis]ANN76109.1 3-hydroxyacyl-CoA dehydrogenase [Bordetella flabilis]
MTNYLQGRVAIVTGAGSGLGRSHAIELARHGARVVVNDMAQASASAVVEEIRRDGGEAVAIGGDVTAYDSMQDMAAQVMERWQRIDILVNNAGILRDKSFSKMSLEDFRQVMDVHLMGSVHCIKAVWETMRAQRHGRIVMTTSSSGLYGNFGQSNYGAAKMALVGLMQTLALEGEKYGIRVNCLAPTAATAMTQGVLTPDSLARLSPDAVSPALVALVGEDAPTRCILLAGGGSVESANVTMTRGIFIGEGDDAAMQIRARMQEVRDRQGEVVPATGFEQCQFELAKAGYEMALPGAA